MKCRNWHKPICVQTPKSMMSRSRFVELDLNPSNSQLSWVIYFSILINGCNAACAMLSGLALAEMGKKIFFFSGNFYQMVNKIFIFVHELSKSLLYGMICLWQKMASRLSNFDIWYLDAEVVSLWREVHPEYDGNIKKRQEYMFQAL